MDPEVTAMATIVGAIKGLSPEQLRHISRWNLPTTDAEIGDLAATTAALQTTLRALRALPDPTQRQLLARWTLQRFTPAVEPKTAQTGAHRGPGRPPKEEGLRRAG